MEPKMTPQSEREALKMLETARMKMTPEAAQKIEEFVNSLIHYRDSTVGLWVTDKPQSVDEKRLFFQLKFGK